MKLKVGNKLFINTSGRPLIVAEISGNHNGNKKSFLDHIISAKKAGADMIKIQTYEPQDITIKSNKGKFLIKKGIWKGKNLWDLYKKAHTPFLWHKEAFKLSKKLKIPLFSTPFSKRSLNFLSKFKPNIYKIASFEITDLSLIKNIAKKMKPIIISTGLSTYEEIDNAIKVIKKYHNKIIILYCVSGYPTPERESNVSNITKLKKKYKNYIVGISDHTNDINSSLASTVLGAKLIEKHFKISEKVNSPDSKFSINYKQLKDLREKSEKIYETLGNQSFNKKKSEKENLYLRRSIFATRDIKKNEKLNEKDIVSKRPKIGIGSEFYFKILGKKINKNIKKNEPIYQKNLISF